MKSWWIKSQNASLLLESRDVPEPQPGPGEIVVRMRAAALNRGEFNPRYLADGAEKIGGHEAAGEVHALGASVSRVKVGERVMGRARGGFSEFAVMSAYEALPVPPAMSWEQAAGVPLVFLVTYDMLIRSGALDILVIDSVAALVPRAEIEGEMGDSHVGLQARLMSQALRKLTGALSNSGTTAIFINQLREKIGVMFGSPETTTGGKALKFYASVRLDVRRIETLKDGTEAVGNRTRCKVVKNKVAPPFKQAEFDILYGKGISREGSLIDMGVDQGFVRKSGSWFTYEGEQLGQGKENARTFLIENPDVGNEIEKKIKEKLGIGAVVTDGPVDDVLPAPVDF